MGSPVERTNNDQLTSNQQTQMMLILHQAMSNSSAPVEKAVTQTGELFQKSIELMRKNFEALQEENSLYRKQLLEKDSQQQEIEKAVQVQLKSFEELIKEQRDAFKNELQNIATNYDRKIESLQDEVFQQKHSYLAKIAQLENQLKDQKVSHESEINTLKVQIAFQKNKSDEATAELTRTNQRIDEVANETDRLGKVITTTNTDLRTHVREQNTSLANRIDYLQRRHDGHFHNTGRIQRRPLLESSYPQYKS